ncbi:MAG: 1-deoxy-D-xylulose-5-phosphate reductoisomerase [Candidatus Omnitrophota bacterium]
MNVKRVAILGSTGSIGINALKVIDRYPNRFRVVGLTAYNNVRLLEKQIRKYQPFFAAVHPENIGRLKRAVHSQRTKILDAHLEMERITTHPSVDLVILGISGSIALEPFLSAIRCGKTVALANKEAIVMAGDVIMKEAQRHQAAIIPVDSEQSAIFQCLSGNNRKELKKVYLTASGGPLYDRSKKDFDQLSVEKILKHPRWQMGKKITVDSATLMNKGLEIIEAKWLFGLKVEEIDVLIHPQAIIHSMVEYQDGSIMAQMGITDMQLPIQYALTYPNRLPSGLKTVNFDQLGQFTFAKPDIKKFPSLALCYDVAKKERTFPCVLNAANEEAVRAFLERRINFSKIHKIVEKVVCRHKASPKTDLKEILDADAWARQEARKVLSPLC